MASSKQPCIICHAKHKTAPLTFCLQPAANKVNISLGAKKKNGGFVGAPTHKKQVEPTDQWHQKAD